MSDTQTKSSPSSGLAGSMFGETSEEYYCKRDDFTRYISHEVNPARIEAGLEPLDMKTAEECFRILNDFARKWIQSNKKLTQSADDTAKPKEQK